MNNYCCMTLQSLFLINLTVSFLDKNAFSGPNFFSLGQAVGTGSLVYMFPLGLIVKHSYIKVLSQQCVSL